MRLSDHLRDIDPEQLFQHYSDMSVRDDAIAASRGADPAAYFEEEQRSAILFEDLPQVAAFAGALAKSSLEEGFSQDFAEGVFAGIMEFARALCESEARVELDGVVSGPSEDDKPVAE